MSQTLAAIYELLEKKHSCYIQLLAKPNDPSAKSAYRNACSKVQASLRSMQNDWWTALASRIQLHADMRDMRSFYDAIKAAYGPSHQIQAHCAILMG